MKYDVIIIGSGLGGLECGYILSKKGYNVCVLEKNPQLGGCLQSFCRDGVTFDTGFHFVGGLGEGQFLHKLFRYFDLLDLPWHKLDEEAFAEVVMEDKSYLFASGHDRFVDTLVKDFPHQQRQLKQYAEFLKGVGDSLGNNFYAKEEGFLHSPLLSCSAHDFLQQTIDDPLLRNVLSGASLTMELCPDKLPLYIFAQINNSFIQSAWRLRGKSSLIADKLAQSIRQMGGTVITQSEVSRLVEESGRITVVECKNGQQIEGKHIISNIHPARTLSLISQSRSIRNIYRKRITDLPNTCGMFTVHLKLKPNIIPYKNRNIYLYKDGNPWDYCQYSPKPNKRAVLINYQVPDTGETFTRNIDLLMPMHWEEVSKWENTSIEHRGEEYGLFKRQKAEEIIAMATDKIPELKDAIEQYYTSTPLTYRDYTGTWNGSAYGIGKDYSRLLFTMLSPQTQIPNLLLTGQNLNFHGILGVSMTSILTCGKLAGMENLAREILSN